MNRSTGMGCGSPRQLAARFPLQVFFTLAYAFAWMFFVPMVFAGTLMPPLIVAGSFGPAIAAVVTHRLGSGNYRAFPFVSTWPRVVVGTMTAWVLVVIAFVVLPGLIVAKLGQLHWGILGSLTVFNASTLLGGPLGEEPGWRGYALPRLQERFGPIGSSLLIGVLWAGWHLPLFFVPGWSSSPFWIYLLMVIALSVILTFSVNLAGLSVITAIAGHAAFNTVSRWLAGFFVGVEPHLQLSMVTLMALTGVGTAFLLMAITKGRLGHNQRPNALK
jgi:membrane protease YdiL (CAAX protease family)